MFGILPATMMTRHLACHGPQAHHLPSKVSDLASVFELSGASSKLTIAILEECLVKFGVQNPAIIQLVRSAAPPPQRSRVSLSVLGCP